MDRETAIKNIIDLPFCFAKGQASFVTLLKDSGYLHFPNISVSELITALNTNDARVNDWLQWSADKRVAHGWFFIESSGKFTVGYTPSSESYIQDIYDNSIEACANFILKEIESCSIV